MIMCRFAAVLTVALLLAACGGEEEPATSGAKKDVEIKPTVHVPPPVEHYEGTPYWLIQSKNWPAVMEWTMGAGGEYTHDSLTVRLSGTVVQNFISGMKDNKNPIMCSFELTVRPVPRKLVGYSYLIDSVSFYDPIKKVRLPSLPMLSSERHTEKGVVRTRFSNNLAKIVSPDLQENQLLEPTVYITSVDKKMMKVSVSPINVTFIKEIKPEIIPTDSLKWGPS